MTIDVGMSQKTDTHWVARLIGMGVNQPKPVASWDRGDLGQQDRGNAWRKGGLAACVERVCLRG